MTTLWDEPPSLLDQLDDQFTSLILASKDTFMEASRARLDGRSMFVVDALLNQSKEYDKLAEKVQEKIRAEIDRQLGKGRLQLVFSASRRR
jgi:hypothetical protein